jgi:hypothetical protein
MEKSMCKHMTALVLASALVLAVLTAPVLYAKDAQAPFSGTIGRGMMGMMGRMDRMMDHCNAMMQSRGNGRPNEQWRKHAPTTPDKNG